MSKVIFIYFGMFVKVFTQSLQMTSVQTLRSRSLKVMAILKAYYKNTSVIKSRSKVNVIYFGMFVIFIGI